MEFRKENFVGKWALSLDIEKFIGELCFIDRCTDETFHEQSEFDNHNWEVKFKNIERNGFQEDSEHPERFWDNSSTFDEFKGSHHQYYKTFRGDELKPLNEAQLMLHNDSINKKMYHIHNSGEPTAIMESVKYGNLQWSLQNELEIFDQTDIYGETVTIKNISIFDHFNNTSDKFEDHYWDVKFGRYTYYGISGKNLLELSYEQQLQEVVGYAMQLLSYHVDYDKKKRDFEDYLDVLQNSSKDLKQYKIEVFNYLKKQFNGLFNDDGFEKSHHTPKLKNYRGVFKVKKTYYNLDDTYRTKTSIIGVMIKDERIYIKHINGKNIDVVDIAYLTNAIKPYYDIGKILSDTRKNIFDVQIRKGYSGCEDMFVNQYIPIKCSEHASFTKIKKDSNLHISMYGTLNRDFEGWLGNAVEVLPKPKDAERFSVVKVTEIYDVNIYANAFGYESKAETLSSEIFG